MSPTRAPALHPDPAGPLRVGRGLLVVLLAGLIIVSCGIRRAPDHRDALADVPASPASPPSTPPATTPSP